MTDTLPPRKILVPIDFYGVSRASLQTLVQIAGQMQRGLLGLMLEDLRLQRVADLPFTTEILLHGGEERRMQREQLSRRHSLASADTGKRLKELAQRGQVDLVLEYVVGDRLHTALARDAGLDIFFPARQRWQQVAARPSARHKAIARLGCVLAHTAQDQAVIETAHLLQKAGLVGEIYVVSTGALNRAQLDSLYQPGSRICVQANLHRDPASIGKLLRYSPYDLLLLPRDCLQGIAPEALEAVLDKASGQLLVIN
tara:strand:+ start:8787 stop:9554 length:768 start_codon:yes stop_codon:yes gene_type:complete